jgi:hypothetical protein
MTELGRGDGVYASPWEHRHLPIWIDRPAASVITRAIDTLSDDTLFHAANQAFIPQVYRVRLRYPRRSGMAAA